MVTVKVFFITVFAGLLLANTTSALEVTSDDLINKAVEYDKKEVVYTGEVIGDIMKRGEYSWINVSDGGNAIGIWLPYEEAIKIKHVGKYKQKGDTAKITGVFNRACAEHGGDFDIHTSSIEIVKQGFAVKSDLNFYRLITGIVLFIIALSLSLFIYRKKI